MAKVYAVLIRKGIKTIDDVPEKLRAELLLVAAVFEICRRMTKHFRH